MGDVQPPETESVTALREYPTTEPRRIIKNILIISISFMVNFTGTALSALQSSILKDEGLGTTGLACLYGGGILGNLFLPALLIRYLGCKWTIAVSILMGIPYYISQSFPSFLLIVPTAFISGIFSGVLYVAQSTYFTIVGETYSRIKGTKKSVITGRFFGVFHGFLQLTDLLGNGISTALLSVDEKIVKRPDFDYNKFCGANYCSWVAIGNLTESSKPSNQTMYIMTGVFSVFRIIAAMLILIFVDSLQRYQVFDSRRDVHKVNGFKLLLVTLKLLRNRKQQLLIFLSLWAGTINAFSWAEYTAAYVSCGWGIQNIGYTQMIYGTSASMMGFLTSWIVEYVNRRILICVAMLVHLLMIVVLRIWVPTPNTIVMFIISSMILAACWNVWYPMHYAVTGALFKGQQEAAFSNMNLWLAVSSVTGFLYSPYLCVDIKIYICIVINILAVVCYVLAEIKHKRSKEQLRLTSDPDEESS